MRRGSLEKLAYRSQCLILQCVAHPLQKELRRRRLAADAIGGKAEGSEKPAPRRTLMIAAVALQHTAAIARMISGTARRQRAQPECGEQMPPADPHDSCLILRSERTVRQADGEDLVRSDPNIVAIGPINDIVQTFA